MSALCLVGAQETSFQVSSIVVDESGNLAQKLKITGTATLGTTLEIDTPFSYEPEVGDEFEIMTYTSKTVKLHDSGRLGSWRRIRRSN